MPLYDSEDGLLHGVLLIPKTLKGLVVFAHGSGSNPTSPRNEDVANILNLNGFATFPEEQKSDIKTQIFDKYANLILNKFNIKLLATRLETTTN